MLAKLLIGCVLSVVVSSNNGIFSIYETDKQITADGYPVETHHVTTSDGYILEMHRIPHGRSGSVPSEDRPVVFLMHGLMSASNAFVALGPEDGFAYHMVNAGFDVWMGNARGNKNSRRHISLNPDDEKEKVTFFDFTFEEIGRYDLPAMIDYVLEHTGKDQLHYVGHSQGGTVFLILATMVPEYNQKILSAHLMGSPGYQEYFPHEDLAQAAAITDIIYAVAVQRGAVELYPPGSTKMLPEDIFTLPSYGQGDLQTKHMDELFGMRNIMRNTSEVTEQPGETTEQPTEVTDQPSEATGQPSETTGQPGDTTDRPGEVTDQPGVTTEQPAEATDQPGVTTDQPGKATDQPGAATKQIAHFGQNIRDKLFQRYNYGAIRNLFTYGRITPPTYDLSLITTFVTMHFTLNDVLLDQRDVLNMVAAMPKAVARQVARTSFLHEDFVAATDAKELVVDYIIEAILNTGQEDHYTVNESVIVVEYPPTEAPTNNEESAPEAEESGPEAEESAPEYEGSAPGSASLILININLIVLSLYLML